MNVSEVLSTNSASPTAAAKKEIIKKDDFLKMLVAQLKHQNPLEPLSGTDFASQLAQFSSLEQLQNMTQELKNLAGHQTSMNNAFAVNLIGKEVTARQDAEDKDITGIVSAVKFKEGNIYLTIADKEINMANVLAVK